MIRYIRFLIIFLLAATAFSANAQTTATTSSPYSRYGLGDFNPSIMPQNIGMGGIATATNVISGFNNINPLNPASYSRIGITIIDVGLYSKINTLNKTGFANQSNTSFRLSHLAFGFPVSARSAVVFGLTPYTELGYSYRQVLQGGFGSGLPADTNSVNYIYNGDGGLTKFYLGYGFGIGKHLSIGANGSYIFGNLKESQSTEVPNLIGVLNSRIEESNSINGFNFDFGAQYSIDLSAKKHITLGYSASAGTKLNTQNSYIVSNYFLDAVGNEQPATDSIINRQTLKGKVQLPMMNHFGISFQNDGKFLIGADYSISNWSKLTVAGVNKDLKDSRTLNVGGQFTPNINSLSSYFASVDYRLGFILDDTYMRVNNTNIKRYAATAGLGLPLRPNNGSFYKINIAAEVGRRGTLVSGLVRENYVNLHLSFTLNDKWFTKYKFD